MDKKIFKISFWFSLLLIVPHLCFAAVQVSASIDDTSIDVDGDTTVTVSVVGDSRSGEPVIPRVDGLEIELTGRSSNIQIVNGSMSLSSEFIYTVVAQREGVFQIPAFVVTSGGANYKSNSLSLSVGTTLSHGNSNHNQQTARDAQEGLSFWLDTRVEKKEVFVGSEVMYHFKLYTRENITQAAPALPAFNDFFSEVVVEEKRATEVVNGQNYATWEKIVALFPLKAGVLNISGAAIDIVYETQERQNAFRADPFFSNNFFNFGVKKSKKDRLKGRDINLKVNELPQPVPAGFTGLVGNFGVQSQISATQVVAGESVTLEIAISGQGNIKDAILPAMQIDGVKTYFDKPTVETLKSPQGISGKKTFKVALVPTVAGDVAIGEMSLTYLSPDTGEYVDLVVPARMLKVLPAREESTNSLISQGLGASKDVGYKDIAPLFSDPKVVHKNSLKISQPITRLILWAGPLIFLVTILISKIRRRFSLVGQKNHDKRELKRLRSLLGNNKSTAKEVWEATQDYFAALSGMEARAMTAEDVRALSIGRKFKNGSVDKLLGAIERLEATQYGSGDGDLQRLKTEMKSVFES